MGDVESKNILDAGCGIGYLSLLLTKQGALVTGIEPASKLYNVAVAKEQQEQLGITYVQEDLSALDSYGSTFDVVVSNMVFMDLPNYQSAIKNCITALKPNGLFIFSIIHPCFEEDEHWEERGSVEIREYFKEYEVKQISGYFSIGQLVHM